MNSTLMCECGIPQGSLGFAGVHSSPKCVYYRASGKCDAKTQTPDNVPFLLRLHKMDKMRLTTRDVLILFAIISKPGINGKDISEAIGVKFRSGCRHGFVRLERMGFIEDCRKTTGKAVPAIFRATDAGRAFWEELIL